MTTSQAFDTAPEKVQQEAAQSGMQSRYVVWEATGSPAILYIVGTVMMGLLAVVAGPVAGHTGSAIFFGLLATGCVTGAVSALASAGEAVYLFDSGFVHVERSRVRSFTWANVRIKFGMTQMGLNISYSLTANRSDGERVALNQDKFGRKGVGLVHEIQGQAAAAQFPRALAAVAAGEAIEFGPVSVDAAGIQHGHNRLLWEQGIRVQISDGRLYVQVAKANRFVHAFSIRGAEIPDVLVVLALAKAFQGNCGGARLA